MKTLLVVVVLLLVAIGALGFYRGWFRVSTDNTTQRPSATITVDQNKIKADENKLKERVQEFGNKAKETTGDDTEKVR
jgi:hypothetical protein